MGRVPTACWFFVCIAICGRLQAKLNLPSMPRYAAIDIGSNSVRMLAAEVSMTLGESIVPLASDRQVTRLGESVFRSGRFDEASIGLVCDTLRRMAETYRRFDVSGVRAVATAATRDASNRADFLARVSDALGTDVEVISGQEEARLIHLGVQSRWPAQKGRVLIVDVGGGSAEIMLSQDGRLQSAWSKPLGAVRLTEVFLGKTDPPAPEDLHHLEQFIDEKIHPALAAIGRGAFDRMIATSATAAAVVCGVNRIPRARREEADRLRATRTQVRKFFETVATKGLVERKRVTGIGPRRAEIIVAGSAVFLRVMELFQHSSMYYSAAGVREGIVADLAARGIGQDATRLGREQRAVVEKLARKFGVDARHARLISGLSRQLFDSLEPLHQLPAEWGRLLEAASYLVDTGHYISDTAHHKHAAYVVVNADLPGFTDSERRLIALLCRFHRKSMPAARHTEYQALPQEVRRALLRLIPILRLADSLDQSHEQHVEAVRAIVSSDGVEVRLVAHGDTGLEEWASERLAEIFRQVYGVGLRVVRVSKL
jgi:exopolyphosphatase / guanosine-5'-triphosphate,3'-diphosphate pyrophosphatase